MTQFPKCRFRGQTLVETALILPFVLVVTFAIYELSLLYMEHHVTQYAAFMAARSHQVFGNQLDNNGERIFVSVGRDIINKALPFIKRTKIDVYTDGWLRNNEPQKLKDVDWRKYRDFFNLETLATNDVDLNYLQNTSNSRHGVLQIKYDHEHTMMFSDTIRFGQNIIVPYRLEVGVRPDLESAGENYIFP